MNYQEIKELLAAGFTHDEIMSIINPQNPQGYTQAEPQPEPEPQPEQEPQPEPETQPEPEPQQFAPELINKLDKSISRLIETIQASNLQSNSIADVGNDTLTQADEIMKSIIRPKGQKEGG